MKTHLVIPDSHAKYGVRNDRFSLLGKFILDLKPDVIVNIGDMADMESLCSYNKGKKSFEGRRYKKDIQAVRDALDKMHSPTIEFNRKQRDLKQKQYKPEMYFCLGNHENRVNRAIESHPELEGTISIEDFGYENYGYDVIPFMSPVLVDNILYSHYFVTGIMGKPISGLHPAYSIIQKKYQTATQGHSHLLDYKIVTTGDGRKLQGLSVGCFLETDQFEEYAGEEANDMWWRGIVVKHITDNGYDPEFISIERLEKMYAE